MNLYLAPLQGVTEYPFRNAWQKHFHGLDAAYSPFIATSGNKVIINHIRDVLPRNNAPGLNLVPQILGNNGAELRVMANTLAGMGYREINLNLGCPSAIVVRHKRGCGLLPFPEMVDSILNDLIQETGISLSVKIRSGLNNTDELWRILEVLNKYPIWKIILHPRLGIQMYEGEPDLDVFSLASAQTKHNLVYNGDIKTSEHFTTLKERFPGITEWMLGRGVLMNPFLPGILKGIKPPDNTESANVLKAFHQDILDSISESGRNEKRMAAKIKEYWNYFSHWFNDQQSVWYEISRARDITGIRNSIEKAFKGDLRYFC